MEKSKSDKENLQREIESLKEIAESRKTIDDDSSQNDQESEKRIRELEDSIRQKNKLIHQLIEENEQTEKLCIGYEEKCVDLRDELSEGTKRMTAMTSEYVSLKENNDQFNGLIESLQKENSRLRALLDDSYAEKTDRDNELDKLSQQVDERFNQMVKRLEFKDAEIEELRARLNRANLNERRNDLGGGIESQRENIGVLTQAIKDRETQIERLQKDLSLASR